MVAEHVGAWIVPIAVVLFLGYNLLPSPPPPPVKETATSTCIARVAGQHAQALKSRIEYLSKNPGFFSSPETKLAERRQNESYCAQEAACFLLDETDAKRRRDLYNVAFSQCLEDNESKN